ncbi:hypothetical protein QYM36_018568 [Artemia franciscana]|uniref:Uncharacterized protein n=1 Tax=Artemia franciscana TaxID=6661 RepID=A0AA88KTT7_ARTSF|nr:hypothetical protein QYM36_018568 [Artemia franciscana]
MVKSEQSAQCQIFRTVNEFDENSDFADYVDQLEQYFNANDNTREEKKRAVLLTSYGAQTYALIKNLLGPEKPSEKSFAKIARIVKEHLCPRKLVIAEGYKFHQRSQRQGESVNTTWWNWDGGTCDFGKFFSQALRNHFVCGQVSRDMQKRLLTENDLTLSRAIEITSSMEDSEFETINIKDGVASKIHKFTKANSMPENVVCYRYRKGPHKPNDCYSRNAECRKCQKKGHTAVACRSKPDSVARKEKLKEVHLKPDVKPKFFKARAVPLAIREKVESELNRPVKIGVLEKVDYNDRASPIVPVNKHKGSVRICGDIKATVNPSLNPKQYPMSTAEEIFSNLQGGKSFLS